MCLVTDQLEPQVLTEDLTIYKILGKRRKSPHQKFYYKVNVLYETDFTFEKNYGKVKFYDNKEFVVQNFGHQKVQELFFENKVIIVSAGFHGAIKRNRLKPDCFNNESVYKCIIPAGASVYYESSGLIVSNKIIIPKL